MFNSLVKLLLQQYLLTQVYSQPNNLFNSYKFNFDATAFKASNSVEIIARDWHWEVIGALSIPTSHLVANTTKKWGYPNICKTVGIAPKNAGIGQKCLSQCFFSWHFKLPRSDSRYRSQHFSNPVPALCPFVRIVQTNSFKTCTGGFQDLYWRFLIKKSAGIAVYLYQRFRNCPYRVLTEI